MLMTWDELDLLSYKLYSIRYKIIPSLKESSYNASLGIWSSKTPKEAIKSYDILQILRYQKSYYFNPEDDIGVCYDTPFIQGKWNIDDKDMKIIKQVSVSFNKKIVKSKYKHSEKWWPYPIAINKFRKKDCTIICQKKCHHFN